MPKNRVGWDIFYDGKYLCDECGIDEAECFSNGIGLCRGCADRSGWIESFEIAD